MIRLVTLIVLVSLVSQCVAQDSKSQAEAIQPRTRFIVPRFNSTGPSPNDYECISARSSDYYGIGVRLGIYFSWWTAWAASAGMPDEISTALDQNTVFLFANLVALVRCTITFVLTQLDGLILMHLAMGTIIGVMSNWGYRTCRYQTEGVYAMKNFGGIGTHLRLLCNLGVCIYGVWYWNTGIMPGHQDMINDTGRCRTVWTFMFGKVDAAGPIRIFYLFFSILWALHFGVTLFVAPFASWVRLREISESPASIGDELPPKLWLATGFNYRQLRYIFQFLRVFTAFWLAWSMITIEITLNYNHVKNVLGPGGRIYFPSQLIPMILGAFTFLRLVWKKYVQSRRQSTKDMSAQELSLPQPAEDVSTSKSIVKLITPSSPVTKKEEAQRFQDDGIHNRMRGASLGWRLLVAYLPWLSLMARFRRLDTDDQTPSTISRKTANDLENHDLWDQDTPRASPDPRGNSTFASSKFRLSSPLRLPRKQDEYNIDRFENTIS